MDRQGHQIAVLEVSIGRDVGELKQILDAAIPGNEIAVKTIADSVILVGSVGSAGEAQKALDIASGFIGTSVLGGTSNGAGGSHEGIGVSDRATNLRRVATEDFFARARARLTLEVPPALTDLSAEGARGDLDLNPDMWVRAGVKATKPAAVLVPVIDRPEPTVLLTLRTAELSSHAGQVAFPGGKIDPADESPVAAALREAREEIGLAPNLIEPLGYLDLYLTFSGFRILPTLARVKPDFTLTLNPREVGEAFEVPLAFVMTPANYQRKTRDWNGLERDYYAVPFENRYIWGITAGILRNLYDRIYAA